MKSYKAVLFTSFFSVASLVMSAQSVKCDESVAVFKKAVIAGKYDDAAGMIAGLQKSCAKYDEELYKYAGRVYEREIEYAKTDEERKKAIDKTLAIYDAQRKNFPTGDGGVRKALIMHQWKLGSSTESFSLLDNAFGVNKANISTYRGFNLYYDLCFEQFTAKENPMPVQTFLKKYSDILGQIAVTRDEVAEKRAEYLDKKEKKTIKPDEKLYLEDTQYVEGNLDAVSDNISNEAGQKFDCATLEGFYVADYDKNKDSAAWLRGMLAALKASKCTRSELYLNAAEQLYKLKPTYALTFELSQLWQKKNNIKKALAYYEMAASAQSNPATKADIYMMMAELYRNGDAEQAKQYALKAAQSYEKTGRPYLFIAEMYASVQPGTCGLSAFESKALVYAAIATLKKAEIAEPLLKSTVASMEAGYLKQVPTKKEAKEAGKRKDDVITYGCWISETVTLPKLR